MASRCVISLQKAAWAKPEHPRTRLSSPEPTSTTDANPDTVAARIQMAPRSTSRPIARVTKASNAAIHDRHEAAGRRRARRSSAACGRAERRPCRVDAVSPRPRTARAGSRRRLRVLLACGTAGSRFAHPDRCVRLGDPRRRLGRDRFLGPRRRPRVPALASRAGSDSVSRRALTGSAMAGAASLRLGLRRHAAAAAVAAARRRRSALPSPSP